MDFPDYGTIVSRLAPTGLQPGQFLFYGSAYGLIPANASAVLDLGVVPEDERWIFYRIWTSAYDNALTEVYFERAGIILSRDIGYFGAVIESASGMDAHAGDAVKIVIVNKADFTRGIFVQFAAIKELI